MRCLLLLRPLPVPLTYWDGQSGSASLNYTPLPVTLLAAPLLWGFICPPGLSPFSLTPEIRKLTVLGSLALGSSWEVNGSLRKSVN